MIDNAKENQKSSELIYGDGINRLVSASLHSLLLVHPERLPGEAAAGSNVCFLFGWSCR